MSITTENPIKKVVPIDIVQSVLKNKTEIRHSVPADLYQRLIENDKILYRGKNIKSAKIAEFCDVLYKKREQSEGKRYHNLSATIMQRRYGCHYKSIVNFLVKEGYIKKLLDYKPGVKAITYYMTKKMISKVPKTYINKDKVTIKNYKASVLNGIINRKRISENILKGLNFNNAENIPDYIKKEVRSKIIEDLYTIGIDKESSLESAKNYGDELTKYYNKLRIENIADQHIWYQFDKYGRFHNNFTVLKKLIRENFLTIQGEEIEELDIKNSQPLLLAKIIRDSGESGTLVDQAEFETFAELVKEGRLYQHFIDVYKYQDKKDVKKNIIYKVLFGKNNNNNKANRTFRKAFPTIFEFIKRYKEDKDDYRALSHSLQRIESELIYNRIIKEIMHTDISINLFTVHDSICFPKSSRPIVEEVFNRHVKSLIDSI